MTVVNVDYVIHVLKTWSVLTMISYILKMIHHIIRWFIHTCMRALLC